MFCADSLEGQKCAFMEGTSGDSLLKRRLINPERPGSPKPYTLNPDSSESPKHFKQKP